MTKIVVRMTLSCGSSPALSMITIAKTIEASPRGPNQPTKPTVGRAGACPEERDRNREQPNEGEAEDGIAGDRPGGDAERGPEQHGAEDDEGRRPEQRAELLEQVADLAADAAAKPAEHDAGDEGGDEAGAADGRRRGEGEDRARGRHHLQPGAVDEAARRGEDDDAGGEAAGGDPEQRPVPDLLDEHPDRMARARDPGLGRGDRERGDEDRHAEAVVQAALDVQRLADPCGQARERDDGLPERRVGGGEDDRQDEGLRPGQRAKEGESGEEAEADRQRQPDPE